MKNYLTMQKNLSNSGAECNAIIDSIKKFIETGSTMTDILLRYFGNGVDSHKTAANHNFKYGCISIASIPYSLTLTSLIYMYYKYKSVRLAVGDIDFNKYFEYYKYDDMTTVDDDNDPNSELFNRDNCISMLQIIKHNNFKCMFDMFTSRDAFLLCVLPNYKNTINYRDLQNLSQDCDENDFVYKPMMLLLLDKFLEHNERIEKSDGIGQITSILFQLQ